ncbi:MAG: exosortase/archaeosortase family protein [Chthoniobacterales bacterium]|nr:exosortase/archaeosortase family protein [Chthoniobacterales bacterium]
MNATVSTAVPAAAAERSRIDWFAAAAFLLLWLEIVARLRLEWSVNPQYGYGWTVPFLAAYAFWRRAQSVPEASRPGQSLLAIVLMIGALVALVPVRLIQEANPDWRLLSWFMASAALTVSFGLIYLAGGLRWARHFAFPLLFFLVAVPWPTQFEQVVIQALMRAVASINVEVLNLIGISAVQMGNVIEVSSGFVGIDEACTGVRSLQATFMVALFLGEFYDFTWLRRIVLVVVGAVLAFVCNLIRTFILVYVGAEQGSEAIQAWHDPAGLSILMACLFGLWGVSMLMGGGSKIAPPPTPHGRAAFRISRVVVITILALTVVAEAGTQVWYGVHEARAARVEPWNVTWPTDAPKWSEVPIEDRAQELLRYNEGGGGTWAGQDGRQWTMYFFRWLPGRTAGLFIKNHRPDVCLPATGMTQIGGVKHQVMTANGVTLPIRSYVFSSGPQLYHVYYCYWDGTMPDVATQDHENWTAAGRLQAVKRGKRDIGTQMLEIVAHGYANEEEAQRAVQEQLEGIVTRA